MDLGCAAWRRLVWMGAAAVLLAPAGVAARAQAAKPVARLDFSRYVGPWYAVAQYPRKTKYPCAGPTTVLYALGDKPGTFQMGSFCSLADGGSNDDQADGKLDKSRNGTLKVRTIWPFSTKLLVLDAAPDYSWSIIGSPNHKKLFVLSRTPQLDPAAMDQAKARAAAEGFNTAKLISPYTAPTAPPKASPLP